MDSAPGCGKCLRYCCQNSPFWFPPTQRVFEPTCPGEPRNCRHVHHPLASAVSGWLSEFHPLRKIIQILIFAPRKNANHFLFHTHTHPNGTSATHGREGQPWAKTRITSSTRLSAADGLRRFRIFVGSPLIRRSVKRPRAGLGFGGC